MDQRYRVNDANGGYYTYSVANQGTNASVDPSKNPEGTTAVSDIHTHGGYEKGYKNDVFSGADKTDNNKTGLTGYLGTPSGELKQYDPKSKTESVVGKDLPSDYRDPNRVNDISPVTGTSESQEMKKLFGPLPIFQDNTRQYINF